MAVPKNFVGERVGNNRVELVALLGEGSYGSVYRGILSHGDLETQCAVKCMAKANIDSYHLLCQRREILLHQQVSDGPGVVTMYEAFEEGDYQFIILELCQDGDLWEGIADGHFTEKDDLIRDVFTQVLQSVEYCHSKRVFHRDIKPENILLTDGGRRALLADFGLASGSPTSGEMRCGSPWYMSPECWGGIFNRPHRPYATAPNDVWALGILLINLACGRHAPWKQATQQDSFFRDFIKQPRILRVLLPLSPELHDLLARVFILTPSARISIQDFKTAVQKIKYFAIPAENRAEYHDYQRAAFHAANGLAPSRLLSVDTLIVPVTSTLSSPNSTDEDESIDITDAAKDMYFQPPGLKSSDSSFICNISIADTRPQAVRAESHGPLASQTPHRSLSSTSSAESSGPITPDMPPTILDVEVPDIAEVSQDIGLALCQVDVTPAKTGKGKFYTVSEPFQNILRAIRAL